ncbi:MAG TPA: BatD family protein [Kofleriaceae bacterium]|nr:BatD family protein [Kofleriaceae bacterium]
MRRLATVAAISAALTLALAGLIPASARAQSAQVSVESRQIYAGSPFVLSVTDDGFEESPTPEVAAFQVAGCKVTSLGASPSVSSSISIVNGRRSESREVTFVHRFQVQCDKAGSYQVPSVKVSQGKRSATTRSGRFNVRELGRTDKMAVRLGLPDRPLAIGETFDLTVDWYLDADPDDPSFSIPIFDRPEDFEIAAPAHRPGDRDAIPFSIGGRDIELPFTREPAELDGKQYTRFRFTAQVTPLRPGRFDLPAARVTARLPTGYGRDSFGFRTARTEFFKAEDQARTIEVTPLPAQGQPPGFSGAVGVGFSIEVRASQTVVRVGDPIELEIVVRGAGHLEGVGLPDLGGAGGLPRADFGVPTGKPTGQVIEDGKAKRFAVTVRLLRPVNQVPPIQFAFWNPAKRAYEVATSQAVALSVTGARAVGAGDVMASAPEQAGKSRRPAPEVAPGTGADLSPSAPDRTMRRPWTMASARPIVLALYGAPTLLLAFGLTRRRLRRRGAIGSASRTARGDLDRALDLARSAPAREASPAIVAALRALLRASGRPINLADGLVADLENRAFDPTSAAALLPADLCARVREQAAAWRERSDGGSGSAGGAGGAGGAAGLAIALLAGGLATAVAGTALAAAADPVTDARGAYQSALGQADRAARTRAFGHAQALYRAIALGSPDRPELLTDWGNAALGASDLGSAVLAYRRALRLDPGLERARVNLAWVRAQLPGWAAASDEGGAVDTLLFWHRRMTTPQKHLLAAAAYALLVLLLFPFGRARRARLRRGLAAVPALVALAMWGSLVAEPDLSGDAVVVSDGVVLRAADHPGAPAVLAEPVPAGAETTVIEERDAWDRVTLASGASGWLPAGALARVSSPAPDQTGD